jgi:hypothetical protein
LSLINKFLIFLFQSKTDALLKAISTGLSTNFFKKSRYFITKSLKNGCWLEELAVERLRDKRLAVDS